jgi:outer membrane protein TolC
MIKMRFLATIFSVCFFSMAQAQSISLQDAVNIALKNNLDIQIQKNNAEISKINNNRGVAGGLPSVVFNATDQESSIGINQKLNNGIVISRSGAYSNTINANVVGSMLLYNGFKVVATQKRLIEIQKQSEQYLIAQIQNTMAAVMTKYYTVVREQSYVGTLQQSIDVSQKQLELIQKKKSLGLASDADLFQSQIDLNTRKLEMQSQQTIIKQAKVDLMNLLELPSDSTIDIQDTIEVNQQILLADVLKQLSSSAEISSLDHQIKINEFIQKEVSAERKPSLRLNMGYNFGNTESTAGQLLLNRVYGPFVNMGLSIPIYNGSISKRQQQVATISTQNARLQRDALLHDIQAAVVKTFQSYSNAMEQLKTQQNTFELSKQLVAIIQQRFQLNSATALEVREAQKSFEEAGFRLLNVQYIAKVAEIELQRICNKLN